MNPDFRPQQFVSEDRPVGAAHDYFVSGADR